MGQVMTNPFVVISTCALVALLVIWIGCLAMGRGDENSNAGLLKESLLREKALQKDLASTVKECARLAAENSQLRNTLGLVQVDEAAKKTAEPVKAKSAAEVRKAMEKRNQEVLES